MARVAGATLEGQYYPVTRRERAPARRRRGLRAAQGAFPARGAVVTGNPMFRMVAVVLLLASVVLAPRPALADEADGEAAPEPADERLTVVGGATNPEGESAIVAAYGWPGLQIGGVFAPSERFDLGPRGQLLQGSPIMGLPFALGFELSLPMRIRLLTAGRTDLGLALRPYGLVGRASLVGLEESGKKRWFGYAFGGQGGLRVGHRVHEKIVLGWGVLGSIDFVAVPNDDSSDLVGTVTGTIGIESRITRATLFFLSAEAGYGFAPDSFFDTHLVLRGLVGFAHMRYR